MGHITSFVPGELRGYPTSAGAPDEPETVLLRRIRFWVADLRRAEGPWPRLHEVMAAIGAPDATASLDMVMRVVARSARHPLGIARPRCRRLSSDERLLLHAARLAQDGEASLAEETLRAGMLSAAGAACALGPLEELGRCFASAGLLLRPRSLAGQAEAAMAGKGPRLFLSPVTSS